jgi:DNA-binding beta-propeller fold protein YncE
MYETIRALTFTLLLAALLIATSCGGGGAPMQGPGGQRLGPYVFVVGPTSNQLFTFKEADNGTLSQIATTPVGSGPIAIAVQATTVFQPTLFVLNSGDNTVSAVDVDARNDIFSPTGITAPTGAHPVAMDLRIGAGLDSNPAKSDFGTLFVLNQGSNSISAIHITDLQGHMTQVPGSPFATQANPQSLAVVSNGGHVTDPNFVYVANGTLGTISAFKVNADDTLTELAGSPFAAGANIVLVAGLPSQHLLMASDAGNNKLLGFKVANDGSLNPIAGSPFAVGVQPGAIALDTFSGFVYVVNRGSNNISAFKLDTTTSVLSPVAGSPFAAGTNPVAISVISSLNEVFIANQGSSDLSRFTADTTGVLKPFGPPLHVAIPPGGLQTYFDLEIF